MVKQGDFLPKEKTKYPYLLITATNDLTATILSTAKSGSELPICIESFGDVLKLKEVDYDIPLLAYLLEQLSLAFVTKTATHPVSHITEFLEIISKYKKESVAS